MTLIGFLVLAVITFTLAFLIGSSIHRVAYAASPCQRQSALVDLGVLSVLLLAVLILWLNAVAVSS